jgi:hypothetical protein
MDKTDMLEHSARALLTSLNNQLQNHIRDAFFNDEKLRADSRLLFAQWKNLQEALNYTVPPALKELSDDIEDLLDIYTVCTSAQPTEAACSADGDYDDDEVAANLEEMIREHATNIGVALRPTGLQNDLRGDIPFECRKLFEMYRSFNNVVNPAKHNMLSVADALVELFELYVHFPPSSPPVAMAINKHDDC